DELRTFRKWLEDFAQSFFCKWVKLLYANDRRIVDFALSAIVQQIVIHFARAKDNPLHFVGRTSLVRAENFFEPAVDEFFGRRSSKLRAQQTFRRCNDERFDEVALHLAPQHMEVLSGGSQIADLNIILGARFQKALQPRAGVFRSLAFISV